MKKIIISFKRIFFLSVTMVLSSFFIFQKVNAQNTFPKIKLQEVEYERVPLLSNFAINVVNPIIVMLFGLALAYFVFGVLRFIVGGENEEVRQKGRDHILWGLVGMGIMFAAWSILTIVTNTFGISDEPIKVLRP